MLYVIRCCVIKILSDQQLSQNFDDVQLFTVFGLRRKKGGAVGEEASSAAPAEISMRKSLCFYVCIVHASLRGAITVFSLVFWELFS